jgi:hypothetical protein
MATAPAAVGEQHQSLRAFRHFQKPFQHDGAGVDLDFSAFR